MGEKSYVGIISVKQEIREGGFCVVTSDDLPGLLLCGKKPDELASDIPKAISLLFRLNYGMNVNVQPVADRFAKKCVARPTPNVWAAVPA
jgi:hypothetical protein